LLTFVTDLACEYLYKYNKLPWWWLYVEILVAVLLCGIAIGKSGQRAVIRALLMLGTLLALFLEEVVICWIHVCKYGILTGTQ